MKKSILFVMMFLCIKLAFANDFTNKVFEVKKGPDGYENLEFQFSDDYLLICDMEKGTYTQYSYDVVGGTIYLGELQNPNFVDYLTEAAVPYSLKDGTAVLELVLQSGVLTLYDTGRKQYRSNLAFGIMDKATITSALIAGTVYINANRKFYEIKEYAEEHNGKAPYGYKGGGHFKNDQNRIDQQPLRTTTKEGTLITYREYDVNPHIKGVNRGAERLVIGSDGLSYKTVNHYLTFQLLF